MGRASREKRSRAVTAMDATSAERSTSASRSPEAWYVTEGRRGQQLLAARQPGPAAQVFEDMLSRLGSAPSYARAAALGQLARCLHLGGQSDLAEARVREALEIAGGLVPGDAVTALRASLLSEMATALRTTGRRQESRLAHEAALALAEDINDSRAKGVELSHLAALDMADGLDAAARARYAEALAMFVQAREPVLEAHTRLHLGAILQHAGRLDEAEGHYLEAARIREAHGDLPAAAHAWTALGELKERAGDSHAAEGCYRMAVQNSLKHRNLASLADAVARLAGVLRNRPGRTGEARELALQALSIARQADPAGRQVWPVHGLLADIDDDEAAAAGTADEQRAVLRAQARGHRHLASLAPRILASVERLGAAPSFGRVVILGGLGRCFLAAGQTGLAAEHLRQSLEVGRTIDDESDEMKGLRSVLQLQLGEVLGTLGQHAEGEQMLVSALVLAKDLQDLHGQGMTLCQLAAVAHARGAGQEARNHARAALEAFRRLDAPELEAIASRRLEQIGLSEPCVDAGSTSSRHGASDLTSGFEITVFDDVTVEYAFEPDLILDGRLERRATLPAASPAMLADDACPMLLPSCRSFMDAQGNVRFALPPGEPSLERRAGCIVMRRHTRHVAVAGASRVLWQLVRALDGNATAGEIIAGLEADDRALGRRLLGSLAVTGAVDVSGRPLGRYVHMATKKGVLPGGRLQDAQVRELVADGGYRKYDDAPRNILGSTLPEGLSAFHALTRARRSRRDYTGQPVDRKDFDALLNTACGVTGTLPGSGREVRMRAYPSSGALYAVEIYPVAWRIAGLDPGAYHFRPDENALETVRTNIDIERLVASVLPVEREMVAGAAAMVCLVGHFSRHERKYGQGGYRMLVAEAGHISQMLVLAATALGLAARPFGGVFDDLVNEDLGLEKEQEQFLLAVLIGHAAGGGGNADEGGSR